MSQNKSREELIQEDAQLLEEKQQLEREQLSQSQQGNKK